MLSSELMIKKKTQKNTLTRLQQESTAAQGTASTDDSMASNSSNETSANTQLSDVQQNPIDVGDDDQHDQQITRLEAMMQQMMIQQQQQQETMSKIMGSFMYEIRKLSRHLSENNTNNNSNNSSSVDSIQKSTPTDTNTVKREPVAQITIKACQPPTYSNETENSIILWLTQMDDYLDTSDLDDYGKV
jgi:hypothetical protein